MEADRQPTARVGEGSGLEADAQAKGHAGEAVETKIHEAAASARAGATAVREGETPAREAATAVRGDGATAVREAAATAVRNGETATAVRDGATSVREGEASAQEGETSPCARGGALYKKLPHGPHGMEREAVARNQRVRMYGAMIESVARKGFAKTSVADVIGLAGVSRRAFYEHFPSKEACFVATHNIVARRTNKVLLQGWESERGWANRLHASCRAVLREIERHPKSSHLVMIDVHSLGRKAYDCVRAYNALFERSIVTGFVLSPEGAMCSPVAPRAIVGGLRHVLRTRVDTTRWKRIPGLADELLDWITCARSSAVERLGALPSPPALAPEPPYRLPRFLADESKRVRAMRAIVDLVCEYGYEDLSDAQIAHCAGMTTEAFHRQFRTKEQALLAVVDEFCAELRSVVEQAASEGSSWTEGVRLGMKAYIDTIARHPDVARLAFVEIFGLGPGVASHLVSVSEAFTSFLVDTGAVPARAPTVATEALTGALWSVIGSSAVASDKLRFLPCALEHLTFTVLAPYTGPRAAVEAIEEAVGRSAGRALAPPAVKGLPEGAPSSGSPKPSGSPEPSGSFDLSEGFESSGSPELSDDPESSGLGPSDPPQPADSLQPVAAGEGAGELDGPA